jgi:hypothetical protein
MAARKIGHVPRKKGYLVWVDGDGDVYEKIMPQFKNNKNLPSTMDGVKKKKAKKK